MFHLTRPVTWHLSEQKKSAAYFALLAVALLTCCYPRWEWMSPASAWRQKLAFTAFWMCICMNWEREGEETPAPFGEWWVSSLSLSILVCPKRWRGRDEDSLSLPLTSDDRERSISSLLKRSRGVFLSIEEAAWKIQSPVSESVSGVRNKTRG